MPDPLVPADLDLRDFPTMPLDVARLRDSDLSVKASGDAFRAAILLWCAAWHQVPASSLPDDDQLLAKLAGYGRDLKGWRAIKEAALHGFVKCNDGRLYHPVVGDMALKAQGKRVGNTKRTAAATVAAAAARKELRKRAEDADASVTEQSTEHVAVPKRREEKRREENVVVVDAHARGRSMFDQGDFDLTDRILKAQRLDKHDLSATGTTYFANKWRASGWQPDVIIATIERLMAKREKAPSNLKYFEQAIADAHAELARAVPVGSATGPPRQGQRRSAADVFLDLDDKLSGNYDEQSSSETDFAAGPGVILDA